MSTKKTPGDRNPTHGSPARGERGIALLTVITALVALMVIAVPFAISMRMGQERSEVNNARRRAQSTVDSIINFQKAFLLQTTERVEIGNRAAAVKGKYSDPAMDNLSEIQPAIDDLANSLGVPPEELEDPYGLIAGFRVEDENGKINLNGSNFFALGNLMGLGVLTSNLDPEDTEISLSDTTNFPERGYVKIGRELISYTGKEPGRLTGCTRGLAVGSPHNGEPEQYKVGYWCVNYAAWAIAYYPVQKYPGDYTPWESLDVSDIASLEKGLNPDIPVLTNAFWERIRPYVTVWSKGEAGGTWGNIQDILQGTKLPKKDTSTGDTFQFINGYYYNTGTVVRISESVDQQKLKDDTEGNLDYRQSTVRPRRKDYGMAFKVNAQGPGAYRMELFGKVHRQFRGNQARVQYRINQPVNVNTAPREVLIACFAHVSVIIGSGENSVSRETAGKVADAIIRSRESATPMRSLKDFRSLLTDLQAKTGEITRLEMHAIFRSAVNSHDMGINQGLVPITFRSYDVYTLRASAAINDKRGGRLLAKHSETRVVEIGSQITTVKLWETQADFEDSLRRDLSTRYWTTAPNKTGQHTRDPKVQPEPRWQRMLQGKYFPWDPYSNEQRDEKAFERGDSRATQLSTNGDIRLKPARMMFDLAYAREDRVFVEHFDDSGQTEGFYAANGFPLKALLKRAGAPPYEEDPEGHIQPFNIQFWWRPETNANDSAIIFDWGQADFTNRISCYVRDGVLILAVSDNTETARASELRYDLSQIGGLQQGVFYHFQLVVAGTHPSEMAMILDGRSIGKPNVQSPLAGTVAKDDGLIPLEDTSGFPSRGAVIIGNEVIEYEENTGGALKVRTDAEGTVIGRGARGTYRFVEHVEGTPVTLFGYSRPITETLREGGATLNGDLAPWAMLRVDTVDADGVPDAAIDPQVVKGPFTQGGSAGGGGGGGGGGNTETKTVSLNVIPFENEGTVSSFKVVPYGYDPDGGGNQPTVEQAVQAFQEGESSGYALVVYYGGRSDDGFQEMVENGADDATAPVAELMKYTRSGTGDTSITLTRLADGTGESETANPRTEDWEILLSYIVSVTTTDSNGGTNTTTTTYESPVWILPVSIKTSRASSSQYVNPANEGDRTHWMMQILSTDSDNRPIWEWVRYNELIESGQDSFFVLTKPASEELLFTSLGGNWDENIDGDLSDPPSGGTTPGGTDPGGSDPGGSDPGGSDPGGSDPGGSDPGGSDPPQAPPSDGPGGSPGVPPDDSTPPPDGDGPGGAPGTPPDDTPPPTDPDGPGGAPGVPPDDTPPPTDPDGPGGAPDVPPDDTPPPTDEDGSGGAPSPVPPTDGGEPAPPSEGPAPEPGDPAPPSVTPPSTRPPSDSGGNNSGTDTDVDFSKTTQFSTVANVLRFRGVQGDTRTFGRVDDWYVDPSGDFENSKHRTDALIVPVAGTYGGPREQIATDEDGDGQLDSFGKDFSVWARPGAYDQVVIVAGDDSTSESGDLFVHHSMNSNNARLYDFDGNDQIEPWDFDEFQHFFALTRQVGTRFEPSSDLELHRADYRAYTRLLCFPSGELPDRAPEMSGPFLGRSIEGGVTACTIDEITGGGRRTLFDMTLKNTITATDQTILLTTPEGTPNEEDLPEGPGVLRVGDEMIVWDEVAIEDDAMSFTGCVRGTMRSQPSAHEVGTRAEPMDGIYVALLTSAVDPSTNVIPARGVERFPMTGVVRLEDPEGESAELRLYTTNVGNELRMPIAEGVGGGLFNGRYGSISREFASGMPVFFQAVRTWDRFSEFVDNPEIACFSFSHRFTDAYVKRVLWKQGQMPTYTTVRVVVRLDESVAWNAKSDDVLFLSRGGAKAAADVPEKFQRRMREAGSALKFLRAMEQPKADNLLGVDKGVQANTVEGRVFCIYQKGAYEWTNPAMNSWKLSPIVQALAIEYVQQNRTLSHVDR